MFHLLFEDDMPLFLGGFTLVAHVVQSNIMQIDSFLCIKMEGNQLITFSFTISNQRFYGSNCSPYLA